MSSVTCPLHLMDEMSFLCAPSHNRIVTELYICHPHRQRVPGGQKLHFFHLCVSIIALHIVLTTHMLMSKWANPHIKEGKDDTFLSICGFDRETTDHYRNLLALRVLVRGDEPRVGNAVLSLSWNKRQSCLHTLGAHQTHSDGRWKDTSADTSSDSSTSRTPETSSLFFLPPAGVKEWVSAHCWYFSLGYFTLEWTFLLRK